MDGSAVERDARMLIDGAWVDPAARGFLDVIDPSSEEAFAEIFEEDPDKHRADGHANQGQPIRRVEGAGGTGSLILGGTVIRRHHGTSS